MVEAGCHGYLSKRPAEQANVWDERFCRFSRWNSSEYIDATAEETCPAESVPMSEPDTGPQRAAGEATEAPSAASLEVMDQLKALAHNVTQGNRASDPFKAT